MPQRFTLSAIALALGTMITAPVNGATLTVTSAADNTTAGDGQCTLREAIVSVNTSALNTDCSTVAPGTNDQIVFGPSITTLSTITLTGSHLSIQKNVSITGPEGKGRLTIAQSTADRIFTIPPSGASQVSLNKLTITGGAAGDGAGVYVRDAELTISQSVISANTASGGGGGIAALFRSTLNVVNSTIENNYGSVWGGGIFVSGAHSVTINRSLIQGNSARLAGGGGIYINDSSIVLDDVTNVSNNSSASYGGGVFGFGATITLMSTSSITGSSSARHGGGVFLDYSNLIVSDGSSISSNTAQGYGGGIEARNSRVTIQESQLNNNSAVVNNGGAISLKGAASVASIQSSTLSGNHSASAGGAIFANGSKLNIGSGTKISSNYTQGFGGGVDLANANVSVFDASITENTAGFNNGGAISVRGAEARLTVQRATIDTNAAGGFGGGIYVSNGSVIVNDSTISANAGGVKGGGLMANNSGSISLTNSTVVQNYSAGNGGGINWYQVGGTTYGKIVNSIVADNVSLGQGQEIAAESSPTIVNLGFNVLGHSADSTAQALFGLTPAATDIAATSDGDQPTAFGSILGSAQYTPLHKSFPLVAGSPAISLADSSRCPDLDQLGRDRGVTFFVPIQAANGNIATVSLGGETCDTGSVLYVPPAS